MITGKVADDNNLNTYNTKEKDNEGIKPKMKLGNYHRWVNNGSISKKPSKISLSFDVLVLYILFSLQYEFVFSHC